MLLRNATLSAAFTPAGGTTLDRVDIAIDSGRIATITPTGPTPPPGTDVASATAASSCPPSSTSTPISTRATSGRAARTPTAPSPAPWPPSAPDRTANWTAEDVERRMEFSLRCAYAHGTAAIRTHLDSTPPQHAITWPVFERVRARWAGRIELQGVSLVGPDDMLDPALLETVAATAKAAGGILGGAIAVHAQAGDAIRAIVDAAGRHELDLDLHVDESQDPAAHALRLLAETVLETGFEGRVMAGHCCSLAVQDATTAAATIDRVTEAGIGVVSLPMCNLYLQDRVPGRTPRWRGVTLVQELRQAGVAVCFASDNTRDPFYAYGDLDGLEVLREAARIAHLDHPAADAFTWAHAVGATPARIAAFAQAATLAPGAPADLVLVRARNWTELMAPPQSDRIVLRAGAPIDTTLPDYRELD